MIKQKPGRLMITRIKYWYILLCSLVYTFKILIILTMVLIQLKVDIYKARASPKSIAMFLTK